jgi:hypothetical protein
MVQLYVPGFKPEGSTETLNEPGLLPVVGAAVSHVHAEGLATVNAPLPPVTKTVCDGAVAPG